jgi:hypothetical protein
VIVGEEADVVVAVDVVVDVDVAVDVVVERARIQVHIYIHGGKRLCSHTGLEFRVHLKEHLYETHVALLAVSDAKAAKA